MRTGIVAEFFAAIGDRVVKRQRRNGQQADW
jgi:hypothetical protein